MSEAVIISNKEIAPGYFKLSLKWKSGKVNAGQFVMLRVTETYDPLLRRPFGIYDCSKKGIEIIYKKAGRGTAIMSTLKKGDSVDSIGPLGNGFPMPLKNDNILMVAGGIGIAPFYLIAKRFSKKTKSMRLLFGGRTKEDVKLSDDFKTFPIKIKVSTEDGSIGGKGLITEVFKKELKSGMVVYACGPIGMLKEVSRISKEKGLKCFVSLEKTMSCGIGVCLGCAVRTKTLKHGINYKMVCSDGPVFDSEDIEWERF